jgi:hypothetical protein
MLGLKLFVIPGAHIGIVAIFVALGYLLQIHWLGIVGLIFVIIHHFAIMMARMIKREEKNADLKKWIENNGYKSVGFRELGPGLFGGYSIKTQFLVNINGKEYIIKARYGGYFTGLLSNKRVIEIIGA